MSLSVIYCADPKCQQRHPWYNLKDDILEPYPNDLTEQYRQCYSGCKNCILIPVISVEMIDRGSTCSINEHGGDEKPW